VLPLHENYENIDRSSDRSRGSYMVHTISHLFCIHVVWSQTHLLISSTNNISLILYQSINNKVKSLTFSSWFIYSGWLYLPPFKNQWRISTGKTLFFFSVISIIYYFRTIEVQVKLIYFLIK
jgi:hypothetical protein